MAVGRQRTMVRTASVLAGALALLSASGTLVLAADHAVSISGNAFSPANLTIAVGDTVTWTNSDARGHTATADDGTWDTGNIANGASGSVTFPAAGSFSYHCDIHPEMTGSITVQAAGAGTGGSTTPQTDTLAPASPAGADWTIGVVVLLMGLAVGAAMLIRRPAGRG